MERFRIAIAVLCGLLILQIVRVEYSMTWLGATLLLLMLSLSDAAMRLLARLLGVADASLVLIALAGVFFVFIFFRYSLVVSSLKDHNIQLAQKVGLLEWEVERLGKEVERRQDAGPPPLGPQ
jgi:hypothetical protein